MTKEAELWSRLDLKTKPPRSLGRLEELAVAVAVMQDSSQPSVRRPTMLIFASDHGIAAEKVSAYPQEVTQQMVLNFLGGGAAIAVLSRTLGWELQVVDAGVCGQIPEHPNLIQRKIQQGTGNFLHGPAMSARQFETCLKAGAEIVGDLQARGCNLIGLGEMGIANSSSATLLLSLLLKRPVEALVGPGTGLDPSGIEHKTRVLQQAMARHRDCTGRPREALQAVGGFEMVMLVGAAQEAARRRIPLIVDGFIATAAILAGTLLHPEIRSYCIFSHVSAEPGHGLALEFLDAKPYLHFNLRLGEGTGAALMLPLIESALAILRDMSTFEQAGVSVALPT